MRCKVKYSHFANGSTYYFVDFCSDLHGIRPVGCFPYRQDKCAMIFNSKTEANKVAKYLRSLGCSYVRVIPAQKGENMVESAPLFIEYYCTGYMHIDAAGALILVAAASGFFASAAMSLFLSWLDRRSDRRP